MFLKLTSNGRVLQFTYIIVSICKVLYYFYCTNSRCTALCIFNCNLSSRFAMISYSHSKFYEYNQVFILSLPGIPINGESRSQAWYYYFLSHSYFAYLILYSCKLFICIKFYGDHWLPLSIHLCFSKAVNMEAIHVVAIRY